MAEIFEVGFVAPLLVRMGKAWNEHNLLLFMSYYSKEARMISARGVVVGRTLIERGYRDHYPDSDSMGKLEFPDCHIVDYGHGVATAEIEWKIGDSSGYSLLVIKIEEDGESRVVSEMGVLKA